MQREPFVTIPVVGKKPGTDKLHGVIARLRELIAALDRRTPQPGRAGEPEIAADSAALRAEAVERLAQIEMCPEG